jgi:hypothetical protein
MNKWKSWIAALALLLALPGAARDLSDHWWTESESGWGLSAVQQDDMLLLTIFVYGADRQPLWLTGEARRYGSDAAGNPGFAGPLYRTAGPVHTGPFDPRAVGVTRVGNVTFEAHDFGRATLVYDVEGVTITKAVTRLTFRNNDWGDLYHAVQRANYIGCAAGFTPPFHYDRSMVEVEQEGASFRMFVDGGRQVCTYQGTYRQEGRVGSVAGTYACTDGVAGTFTLAPLQTSSFAIAGEIVATHPACAQTRQMFSGFSLTRNP